MPVPFSRDNIDFDEATPDGTNTLHSTIIVMFQQDTGEASMYKETGIDPKSKETRVFFRLCCTFVTAFYSHHLLRSFLHTIISPSEDNLKYM